MSYVHGDGAVNLIQFNRRNLTRATVLNLARSDHGSNFGANATMASGESVTQLPFQLKDDLGGRLRDEARVKPRSAF